MLTSSTSPLTPGWFTPLGSSKISPAALILIFAALIAFARMHTYFEPLDCDLGNYATIAHEMHFGKHLYTDMPDQKPPAIHVTYYVAEAIAGFGRSEIYLMTVVTSLITLAAAYAACVLLTGNRAAGLWAAAFWTIVSGHVYLEANTPNTEMFMNAFCMLGLALLLWRYRQPGAGWGGVALAGACFAWATLYKQVIVVTPAFLALAYIILPPPGMNRGRAFGEMLLVGGVIVAVWGVTIGFFAMNCQLDAFVQWVFTFNQGYAGNLTGNLQMSLVRIFPPWMEITVPLVILTLVGMGIGIVRQWYRPVLLLLVLAISSHIAIALPGKFFPHYYQLWFPWLIVGAGFGMAAVQEVMSSKRLAKYAGILVLSLLLVEEVPNYFLTVEEWSKIKYGWQFVQSNGLARVVNSFLKPDETFYQLANQTEMYLAAGRRPPFFPITMYGLYRGRFASELRGRLLVSLRQSQPDLLILTRESTPLLMADRRIPSFIQEHYRVFPIGRDIRSFMLLIRKGSNLEKRADAGLLAAAFQNPSPNSEAEQEFEK